MVTTPLGTEGPSPAAWMWTHPPNRPQQPNPNRSEPLRQGKGRPGGETFHQRQCRDLGWSSRGWGLGGAAPQEEGPGVRGQGTQQQGQGQASGSRPLCG